MPKATAEQEERTMAKRREREAQAKANAEWVTCKVSKPPVILSEYGNLVIMKKGSKTQGRGSSRFVEYEVMASMVDGLVEKLKLHPDRPEITIRR